MKTLKQLIADRGIDETHAVKLLRRRQRAALLRDRAKIFGIYDALAQLRAAGMGRHFIGTDMETVSLHICAMKVAADMGNTALYVAAWCRLNHLKL